MNTPAPPRHRSPAVMLALLLPLWVCGAAGKAHAEAFHLVANGTPQAVLVTADPASPTAMLAARELADHIEQATGVRLEITTETADADTAHHRLYIGVTEAALREGIDPETLGPDEFILRRAGNRLFILGREDANGDPLDERHNQRGTFFGAIELLHRHVGVRWLWPGDLGTYVPRSDSVSVPGPLDERHAPALRFRTFGWARIARTANDYPPDIERLAFSRDGVDNYRNDLIRYMARHRLGFTEPKPAMWHSFAGLWQRVGADHPEWFMMDADGRRGPAVDANPWQLRHVALCVSNPDLHRYLVDEFWNGGPVLCLGEVDVRVFCQCPECLAWDGPQPEEFPPAVRPDYTPRLVSDRYARFWKTVYDLAVERNPDVTVSTYLYWNYFPAPESGIQLHEGIYGEFVPWTSDSAYYPMSDDVQDWIREQWKGWARTGIRMAYRPNYLHGGYVMPYFSTWQAGDFFRFAYRHGMVGTRYDSLYGHWATKGPMHYMHMRLFWDPELEIADIRRDYFSGFGPAADLVERYFDYWESYSRTRPGGSLFNPVHANTAYPPAIFLPAERILEQALAAAETDPLPEFAERVRFLHAGLEHARLAARFMTYVDYGPREGFGSVHGVDYDPVPIEDPDRFQKCRAALRDLIAFRRAHEHLYIADFVDAARRENRRIDIDTLLAD